MMQNFNVGKVEARLKKDIKNLEAQIELMKNCCNCKHRGEPSINFLCEKYSKECDGCFVFEKWELKVSD